MITHVIVSASRAENTAEQNERLTNALEVILSANEIPNHRVLGSYQEEGQDQPSLEISFMVPQPTPQEVAAIKEFAFSAIFKQECILVIDDTDAACLVFPSGDVEQLGQFKEVAAEIAKRTGCYTLINGRYFQAAPDAPEWGGCSQATKDAEPEALHDADKPQYNTDSQYKAETEV